MKKILIGILLTLSINASAAQYFNKLIMDQTNLAAPFTSEILDIAGYHEYSIQIIATSTMACTAEIRVSNDFTTAKTMITLAGSSTAFTNTGLLYTVLGGYRYVQLYVSGCAGAGNIKAYFVAKEI